jgi:hypothetical protein
MLEFVSFILCSQNAVIVEISIMSVLLGGTAIRVRLLCLYKFQLKQFDQFGH